jgi:hypothetical protein
MMSTIINIKLKVFFYNSDRFPKVNPETSKSLIEEF